MFRSPLPRERMLTVAADRHPWPHRLQFAASGHATVRPSQTLFNFVVYNDSINLRFIYFHVCLIFSEAGGCHFDYIKNDSNVAQKDALSKIISLSGRLEKYIKCFN